VLFSSRVEIRGGLGRLAAWHLPGGPVGSASRWAAMSNVEVGQTTYSVNGNGAGDRVTKMKRGEGSGTAGRPGS